MTKNIVQYARDVFNLLIGDRVAEMVKWRIGSTMDTGDRLEMEMRGRDLVTGLPRQVIVNEAQVREALYKSIRLLIENIKATIEVTPPELVADIYERGIVLTGGGALLRGVERSISKEADIPVRIAEDPTTASVRGAGALFVHPTLLRDVALPTTGPEAQSR